ncbi:protein kinase, putative [Plasmodium malariae]|uniref:non-specific serine/threonine protein kinase n=1 Tax=Plasmodium malariae TaxID=5858 RepID=A0A1A8X1G8_PLAMA|nr:protein kinase, putative [Plasmodium malariae]
MKNYSAEKEAGEGTIGGGTKKEIRCTPLNSDNDKCYEDNHDISGYSLNKFCSISLRTILSRKKKKLRKILSCVPSKKYSKLYPHKRTNNLIYKVGKKSRYFLNRTNYKVLFSPSNFEKSILSLYKINYSVLKKCNYVKRKIFHIFRKNELRTKHSSYAIYDSYDKKLKNIFINFIFRHHTYIYFIFNIDEKYLSLLRNKFIFNTVITSKKKGLSKPCNFMLSKKRVLRTVNRKMTKYEKRYHCLIDVILRLIRKKNLIITFCSNIKYITVLMIEIENFEKIIKYLLILKNFITTYKQFFVNVLGFFSHHKLYSCRDISSGLLYRENVFVQKRDDNFTFIQRNNNDRKASTCVHVSGIDDKLFHQMCFSFIYLFIQVFITYVQLLLSGLTKYKEDAKKRYILFKIIVSNTYGILRIRKRKKTENNILINSRGNIFFLLKGMTSRRKIRSRLYRSCTFISLIDTVVKTLNKDWIRLSLFFHNSRWINYIGRILIDFLLTLLRGINIRYSQNEKIELTFKNNKHTKYRMYEQKMENLFTQIEYQIIYMFFKKKFLYCFEKFLMLNNDKYSMEGDHTNFIKTAENIIYTIIYNSKGEKRILFYKYYKIYIEIVHMIRETNVTKKKKHTFVNYFYTSNGETLKRDSGNDCSSSSSWGKIFGKKNLPQHRHEFYVQITNRIFLLYVMLSYLKKSKRATKFMKIFLKIFFLISEQKNFALQFYFYKIKILEHLLNYTDNSTLGGRKFHHTSIGNLSNIFPLNGKQLPYGKGAKKGKNKGKRKKQFLDNFHYSLNSSSKEECRKSNTKNVFIPQISLNRIFNSSKFSVENNTKVFSTSRFVEPSFHSSSSNRLDHQSIGSCRSHSLREERSKSSSSKCYYWKNKNLRSHKKYTMSEGYIRISKCNKNSAYCSNSLGGKNNYPDSMIVSHVKNKHESKFVNKYNESPSIMKWTILLIFSLIISYNKKDLNNFYFNENFYDDYKKVNKYIERKIFTKNNKIKILHLKNFLKILNKLFSFHRLVNSEHLPIMNILQSYLNSGKSSCKGSWKSNCNGKKSGNGNRKRVNEMVHRAVRLTQNNEQLQILYNISIIKNLTHLKFLKKINEDGNGKIYMCSYSVFSDQPFIMKLISIKKDVNENYIFKNIFNEIKCLLKFQYVNSRICQVYEYGVVKNDDNRNYFTYYILMKYYDCNLKQYINNLHSNYLEQREIIKNEEFPSPPSKKENKTSNLHLRRRKILQKLTIKKKKKKKNHAFCEKKKQLYKNKSITFYYHVMKKITHMRIIDLQYALLVLKIFNQIVEQIMSIHKRGIVHFDINTSNILMNYSELIPLLICCNTSHKKVMFSEKGEVSFPKECNTSPNAVATYSYTATSAVISTTVNVSGLQRKDDNIMIRYLNVPQVPAICVESRKVSIGHGLIYIPSIVINDFGESKFFFNNNDFLFFRINRGNEILSSPELMMNNNWRKKVCHVVTKGAHVGKETNNRGNECAKFKNIIKRRDKLLAPFTRKNNCNRIRKRTNSFGSYESLSFKPCKCLEKIVAIIKKKLQKKHKFEKRKMYIQKSDIWLLGCVLFEMFTNESLMHVHNFLYIKIYEKKDLLDEIIYKKIKNNFEEIYHFFNYFFQFDLKKRKSLNDIYIHIKVIYNTYVKKLKKERELLRIIQRNIAHDYRMYSDSNKDDRGNLFHNMIHIGYDTYFFDSKTVKYYKKIDRLLYYEEKGKRNGDYYLYSKKKFLTFLILTRLQRKRSLFTDKCNFVFYTFNNKVYFGQYSSNMCKAHDCSRIPFSIEKVKKILHFLITHNIVKIYNFYFIFKMNEGVKGFLRLNNLNKRMIYSFSSIFCEESIPSDSRRNSDVTNVQVLYFKKKLFYKKSKNTKKVFYKYLNFLSSKKYKPIFKKFCKYSKIKIYNKNDLKNLSYFFLFFFINTHLKLHTNSIDENKKYFFILNSDQNCEYNSFYNTHILSYNFSNVFLCFFFFVIFEINIEELFFFFKTDTTVSFSDMDISLFKEIMNNFF